MARSYGHEELEAVGSRWRRESGNWGINSVGSRYQTTDEDTADWEVLVRVIVNCRPCRSVNCYNYLLLRFKHVWLIQLPNQISSVVTKHVTTCYPSDFDIRGYLNQQLHIILRSVSTSRSFQQLNIVSLNHSYRLPNPIQLIFFCGRLT